MASKTVKSEKLKIKSFETDMPVEEKKQSKWSQSMGLLRKKSVGKVNYHSHRDVIDTKT